MSVIIIFSTSVNTLAFHLDMYEEKSSLRTTRRLYCPEMPCNKRSSLPSFFKKWQKYLNNWRFFQKHQAHCSNFGVVKKTMCVLGMKESILFASCTMPRTARSTGSRAQRGSTQRKITDTGLRATKSKAKKGEGKLHSDLGKPERLESPDTPKSPDEVTLDQDDEILGMQSDPGRKVYPDPDVDKHRKKKRLTGPRPIRSRWIDIVVSHGQTGWSLTYVFPVVIFYYVVHQEHLSEQDILLRQFDLDYKFGPCVGLTRLERWGTFPCEYRRRRCNDHD